MKEGRDMFYLLDMMEECSIFMNTSEKIPVVRLFLSTGQVQTKPAKNSNWCSNWSNSKYSDRQCQMLNLGQAKQGM